MFSRSYADAPNPGLELHVDDIGVVGLPLSKREAEVIKSGCRVARGPTLPDVHDAWVIDQSQVLHPSLRISPSSHNSDSYIA